MHFEKVECREPRSGEQLYTAVLATLVVKRKKITAAPPHTRQLRALVLLLPKFSRLHGVQVSSGREWCSWWSPCRTIETVPPVVRVVMGMKSLLGAPARRGRREELSSEVSSFFDKQRCRLAWRAFLHRKNMSQVKTARLMTKKNCRDQRHRYYRHRHYLFIVQGLRRRFHGSDTGPAGKARLVGPSRILIIGAAGKKARRVPEPFVGLNLSKHFIRRASGAASPHGKHATSKGAALLIPMWTKIIVIKAARRLPLSVPWRCRRRQKRTRIFIRHRCYWCCSCQPFRYRQIKKYIVVPLTFADTKLPHNALPVRHVRLQLRQDLADSIADNYEELEWIVANAKIKADLIVEPVGQPIWLIRVE